METLCLDPACWTVEHHQDDTEGEVAAAASEARVLFSGLGADEQLGGYGRHRTAFRKHGWDGLQKELDMDVQRLWRRNLGRDDRCVSAHGKELRLPFLDEGVVALLRRLPLDAKCDHRLPAGVGDKLVLRIAAEILGLPHAAGRTKRAIQFGSRISKSLAGGGSIRGTTGTSPYVLRGGVARECLCC